MDLWSGGFLTVGHVTARVGGGRVAGYLYAGRRMLCPYVTKNCEVQKFSKLRRHKMTAVKNHSMALKDGDTKI